MCRFSNAAILGISILLEGVFPVLMIGVLARSAIAGDFELWVYVVIWSVVYAAWVIVVLTMDRWCKVGVAPPVRQPGANVWEGVIQVGDASTDLRSSISPTEASKGVEIK